MVDITVRDETIDVSEPVVVEGLPGVGLVGKIAADHIINQLDVQYFGDVTGGELPQVALFEGLDPDVKPPVRLFADGEHDLLALRSDVPISSVGIPTFAAELTAWIDGLDTLPIYLGGFPEIQKLEAVPTVYGVSTGGGDQLQADADVSPPVGSGMISGPAGALLSHARDSNVDAVGLVVETDPRFPDPRGARVLIEQREEFARRMQEADRHEGSRIPSVDMY